MYLCYFSEKDEHSKLVHYSIIILGICTLGTSILLWWLYKELAKYCSGKDVEGMNVHTYVHIFIYCKNSDIRTSVPPYTYVHIYK